MTHATFEVNGLKYPLLWYVYYIYSSLSFNIIPFYKVVDYPFTFQTSASSSPSTNRPLFIYIYIPNREWITPETVRRTSINLYTNRPEIMNKATLNFKSSAAVNLLRRYS